MTHPQGKFALIMAAGLGQRMGSRIPKQFLNLRGIPMVCHSINAFFQAWEDIQIVLVVPAGQDRLETQIRSNLNGKTRLAWIEGGTSRYESVQKGLSQVRDPSIVFVHDGARPLVSQSLLMRCHEQAISRGSAIPAVPIPDSLRIIGPGGSHAVDREAYRITQTPQTFRSSLLLEAFRQAFQPSFTDEASVVEAGGGKVHLIEGEHRNIKITYPLDLVLAERILEGNAL